MGVHGASMGPTWVLADPGGPMLAPWTLFSGTLNGGGPPTIAGQAYNLYIIEAATYIKAFWHIDKFHKISVFSVSSVLKDGVIIMPVNVRFRFDVEPEFLHGISWTMRSTSFCAYRWNPYLNRFMDQTCRVHGPTWWYIVPMGLLYSHCFLLFVYFLTFYWGPCVHFCIFEGLSNLLEHFWEEE